MQKQQQALVALAVHPAVSEGDLPRASRIATELVAEAAQVERVGVWLFDEHNTQLQLVDLYHRSAQKHETGFHLSAEEYPRYFAALQHSRYIDAHDALQDPRTNEFCDSYLRPYGITSMVDAALRVGAKVVGILCLEHVGTQRTWQDYEILFAGEASDQLAHAILNRARLEAEAEQERLRDQLFRSQKMEAIGRLAGGIAHDFNNLLTIIAGHAEILLASEDPACLAHAQQIAKVTEQATELTRQLLAFSRQEKLVLTDIDLVSSVASLESMLKPLLPKEICLTLRLSSTPLLIRATNGLLQQILTNLVINARDAIPETGGEIEIDVSTELLNDPPKQGLSELSAGYYAILRVKDSGCGMTKDVLARLFEPFFTTKPLGKGTGLGLSTVYGIAQRCGGAVAVQSEVHVGTQFSVYFPLLTAPSEPAEMPDPTETPEPPSTNPLESNAHTTFGAGRTILVAEDNPDLLTLLLHFLKRMGFRTLSASHTQQALEHLQHALTQNDPESTPVLLLSDMVMPQGGGLFLLSWVKQHFPSLPVAFMSGYMDEYTAHSAADIPCLNKPFSSKDLERFLRRVFANLSTTIPPNNT